ncbi:MAG TPA: succinyl-diaminopimelate desuccinylase [Caulobacteraceae bacterium]|jgi:succinyl-diaminopimelate desuccinylase|nr:succinyl-diaminopimelate desuccinylase [Caulobacteraceae bacterium]
MGSASIPDPVDLAVALIRSPSVTPADAGAMATLAGALSGIGFELRPMASGGIENLYARFGSARPNLCFAGHTDVVPPGDEGAWTSPPFEPSIFGGVLRGRGAADMKSAIAAFVAAAGRAIAAGAVKGSLSAMITGDEEGEALHGTRFMVETLRAQGEGIDHCVVGEPTSRERLGDMIKIGRRGSLNATITVEGVQGHVAYPDRAANPAPVLVRLLNALISRRLDEGYEAFQPSNLEITSIDIGNPASNVIPARAGARVNIRFNPSHRGADLAAWIEAEAARAGEGFAGAVRAGCAISGEAFLTPEGPFTALVAAVVKDETGVTPELSTTGGTSDARFIRFLCPVVEFGLVGASMHQVDEQVAVADIERLTGVYERLIARYFEVFSG